MVAGSWAGRNPVELDGRDARTPGGPEWRKAAALAVSLVRVARRPGAAGA